MTSVRAITRSAVNALCGYTSFCPAMERVREAAIKHTAVRHYSNEVSPTKSCNLERTMAEKNKRVLKAPERSGSIPDSEILKAIKKVAAARRRRPQTSVPNGAK